MQRVGKDVYVAASTQPAGHADDTPRATRRAPGRDIQWDNIGQLMNIASTGAGTETVYVDYAEDLTDAQRARPSDEALAAWRASLTNKELLDNQQPRRRADVGVLRRAPSARVAPSEYVSIASTPAGLREEPGLLLPADLAVLLDSNAAFQQARMIIVPLSNEQPRRIDSAGGLVRAIEPAGCYLHSAVAQGGRLLMQFGFSVGGAQDVGMERRKRAVDVQAGRDPDARRKEPDAGARDSDDEDADEWRAHSSWGTTETVDASQINGIIEDRLMLGVVVRQVAGPRLAPGDQAARHLEEDTTRRFQFDFFYWCIK